jgi:hypothetical protein
MKDDVYIWCVYVVLVLGALAAETKATQDLTERVKRALSNIEDPLITTCDIVGNATQLNEWTSNAITVQWRRALIASSILWILIPFFSGVKYTSQQYFINILLTWVVFSSISGYSDYHVRNQSSNGIDSCLVRAIEKLSFDGDVCSQTYINYVT